MKKGLMVLSLLIFVSASLAFHFYSIKDTLRQSIGDFVACKGRLDRVNADERYIIVTDETGRIKVKIDNRALKYVSEERWGTVIRIWGHLREDASGKYIMARKVRVHAGFIENDNVLH
ncbi:MAG: hypothetical protein PHQ23_14795 [Candidatus Wallbacteria bacterium]|nr:hypothetical protein [Candidatus Wallbacteria bacterium]